MIVVVIVCGLLLMTSLVVMVTVFRRWRRLKREGDDSDLARSGVQLDDLVKLICYNGWRRHLRGSPGHGAAKSSNPDDHTGTGQQVRERESLRSDHK